MQKSSEKLSKQALKKVNKFLKTLKKQEKPLFARIFNLVLHFNSFGISKIQLNLKMCFSKAMEIVKMLMQNGFLVFEQKRNFYAVCIEFKTVSVANFLSKQKPLKQRKC